MLNYRAGPAVKFSLAPTAGGTLKNEFLGNEIRWRMDLKFECPKCGQHLAVEQRGAGMTVNCPSCKERIEIPSGTAPPPLPPPVPSDATVRQMPSSAKGRLTMCRDCGHAISSKATSCPACGAPVKRANYAAAVAVLGIVAFFVIVVVMAVNHENSPSAAKNPVKAQVGLTTSAVAVTNLDEQAWPRVTVYINGTPLDGYEAVYNRNVAPHERILIPFSEFARGDRRFNPFERKVVQAMVRD